VDPMGRAWIMRDRRTLRRGGRAARHVLAEWRTAVARRDADPVFAQTFSFDVSIVDYKVRFSISRRSNKFNYRLGNSQFI